MTTGTKNIYFEKSPDYRLIKNEAKAYFFVYRTGKKILTDALGELIWQALPGSFSEIEKKINQQKCVASNLLKAYLLVLIKADLILLRDERGKEISGGELGRIESRGEGEEERRKGGGEEEGGGGMEEGLGEDSQEGGSAGREEREYEHSSKNKEEMAMFRKEKEGQQRGAEREENRRKKEGGDGRKERSISVNLDKDSQAENLRIFTRNRFNNNPNNLNDNFNENAFYENESLNCPLISVIIVTYNGEEYICRCLYSVFRQTYHPIEVIVVDNASTDATVDLIRRDFPLCRLVELKRNRHYAGGLNRGLKEARGEYILFLNQDVFLEPDCLAVLYNRLVNEPQAGLAAPMIKFASLPGFINGLGNQVNNRGWGTDNFIYCVDIGQFQELEELPSACFGAAFLRREAIKRVGPLDEGYGSFYEDVDWSFRCWFQGMKIVPVPEAVVYHEFGGSYPQGKKLFFVVRNRLRLVLKLFQGRIRLGFLKNYIIEDGRNCLSLLRKRKFRPFLYYLEAYFSLVLQFPLIQVKRWQVMKRKLKNIREKDILIKNPSFYCCLNPLLAMPELDVAVIRRYYLWHLMRAQEDQED